MSRKEGGLGVVRKVPIKCDVFFNGPLECQKKLKSDTWGQNYQQYFNVVFSLE